MANRIAVIKGTFATPGVSRNGRYYSPEMIAETVAEAQKAIDAGEMPVTMLTGHGGRRDSLGANVADTAGRVTKVSISPEGHGLFEADIADTAAGRDVATLTSGGYLKGVSMAGVWKGMPRQVRVDGVLAETADGMSMRGIDFTHNPGVIGAHITTTELAEAAAAGLICEGLEEVVFVEETDGSTVVAEADALTPGGDYADPGWQKDGKKRYPLDTASHVKAAWSYINVKANQEPYTANQVARIKSKIKKAAGKFDINISESMRTLGLAALEAATDEGLELTGLSESAKANLLRSIGMQVTSAICEADPTALEAMTPDDDNDDQMDDTCSGCGADVASGSNFCPACGTPIPQGESAPEEKGAVMPEATTTEGAATEDAPITKADLNEAVNAAVLQTLEAVKAAGEPVEEAESPELIAARKLIAEADAAKTNEPAKTEPAPVAEAAAAGPSAEDIAKMVAEAAENAAKQTLEAVRGEVTEAVRLSGQRRGLVSKAVLEQDQSELYGENADLSGKSLAQLSIITDDVVAPLIGAR